MSYDQLCDHSSVKETQRGAKSLANPRQRPVCAEYTAVTLYVVVGLYSCLTFCWCCVAGLLLALTKCCRCCCISSLTCLLPSIMYLRRQTNMRFWDGCNIIFTHRYVGGIFRLLPRSRWGSPVLIWLRSRRMIRCGNVVPQKSAITTLVSGYICKVEFQPFKRSYSQVTFFNTL